MIETTVGIVKQIATTAKYVDGTQIVAVNIPEGADPDKIDQRVEAQIFDKEEGHYMFTVTQTEINRAVVARPPR